MNDLNEINSENYGNRKVVIQAIGSSDRNRKGKYTLIVPYSRLNKTLQQISRAGGRIVNINISYSSLINPELIETPQSNASQTDKLPEALNVSQTEKVPETLNVEKPEKVESQSLLDLKNSDLEANQKEMIVPTAPPPITSAKIEKQPNPPRRKKRQFDRVSHFKKTIRNTTKIRGKKSRRNFKLYLT